MILDTTIGEPMFSALFSFLGGSAFRASWGEIAQFVQNKQEHAQELEAMKLQAEIADKTHAQEMEKLRTLSELGIKEIEAKSDGELNLKEADAFIEAMKTMNRKSGIRWVDGWNAAIRPLAATTAIAIWWLCLYQQGFNFTEWDRELMGAILGFYFASRVFSKK